MRKEKCPRCHRMIEMQDVPMCRVWFVTHDDVLTGNLCSASLRSFDELEKASAAAKFVPFVPLEKLYQ